MLHLNYSLINLPTAYSQTTAAVHKFRRYYFIFRLKWRKLVLKQQSINQVITP